AIALPHLAPHGRSNGLALALVLMLFGWLTASLRLALAPARFGRRGSRPLHRCSWPPASPTRLALSPHELAPEVLLSSQRIVRMTSQRQIVRSRRPTECVWVHMVQLEKRRLPTALASAIDVSAPRAIALPYLAPHGRSNGLALALALVLFGRHVVSLRFALALVLFSWLTVSLRLALAPARFGRRGSRPLQLGAAALLRLRDQ